MRIEICMILRRPSNSRGWDLDSWLDCFEVDSIYSSLESPRPAKHDLEGKTETFHSSIDQSYSPLWNGVLRRNFLYMCLTSEDRIPSIEEARYLYGNAEVTLADAWRVTLRPARMDLTEAIWPIVCASSVWAYVRLSAREGSKPHQRRNGSVIVANVASIAFVFSSSLGSIRCTSSVTDSSAPKKGTY